MPTDIQQIEKPIKYASIAMLVFVVSAYILGKSYEFLALSAFDLPFSSTWDGAKEVAGLSFDRSVRHFVFYFFSYLAFVCYERSTLKSSPWAMLGVFSIFPALMSFLPFVVTAGFQSSSVWATEAMLMSLLYFGVGHQHPSIILRNFFLGLLACIVLTQAMSEFSLSWDVIHRQAVNLFDDESMANRRTSAAMFWLAPAILISTAVKVYLAYWLPRQFFIEMNGNKG